MTFEVKGIYFVIAFFVIAIAYVLSEIMWRLYNNKSKEEVLK